jgi:hypothetical protein
MKNRQDAIKAGDMHYKPKNPCKKCGTSKRWTRGGNCIECNQYSQKSTPYRIKYPDRYRKYQREYQTKLREKDREKFNTYHREYMRTYKRKKAMTCKCEERMNELELRIKNHEDALMVMMEAISKTFTTYRSIRNRIEEIKASEGKQDDSGN